MIPFFSSFAGLDLTNRYAYAYMMVGRIIRTCCNCSFNCMLLYIVMISCYWTFKFVVRVAGIMMV